MDGDDATASAVRPWLALWFRPRAAIDSALVRYGRGVALAITLCVFPLEFVASFRETATFPLTLNAVWLPLAALAAVALIAFFINGWLLNGAARLIGGKGTVAATRAAYAWSSVPVGVGCAVALLSAAQAPTVGTVALAVAAIWSFVLLIVMLARVQGFGWLRGIVSVFLSFVAGVVFALAFRTLLFQPFSLPSGSMIPTLLPGDYFFASKFDYGYGRYSFPPNLATFDGRIFARQPQRGDVVVFRQSGQDFVKRILGLPGETIQLKDGRLYIDGRMAERRAAEPDYRFVDSRGKVVSAQAYWETPPGGASYRIIQLAGDHGPASNTGVYQVPAGKYFVLGDNRDNSNDSRFAEFGFVGFDDLIGRASILFYSRAVDPATTESRIGLRVK